jgi:hypothetical protein
LGLSAERDRRIREIDAMDEALSSEFMECCREIEALDAAVSAVSWRTGFEYIHHASMGPPLSTWVDSLRAEEADLFRQGCEQRARLRAIAVSRRPVLPRRMA